MVIDAVPEARSYIVNRNGKGKSNGKGLAWPHIETAKHTHWVGKNPLEADRIALRPCEVLKKMCVFFGKNIYALVDFQIWSLKKGEKRPSHPGWCRTTGKMFLPKDTGVVHSYMFQWVGGFGTSTSQVSATHGRRNKVAVEKPAPVGAKDAWKSSTPSTHIHSILFVCIVWFPWRKPLLKITRKLRLTQGWGKPDTKSMWRNQWTIYLRNLMELPWSWWFKTQETCDACPFLGGFKCSKWWQAILFCWCWSCWSLKGEHMANPEQESRKVCCQTCEWRCTWWFK